ncbi:MAG: inactive transglutaminase family protein [Spongiibacteraceae bacterium]
MSPRAQVFIIAFLLIAAGVGLCAYKSTVLGFPLMPGEYRKVWTIEAKVEFDAEGGPATASLALPRVQKHMRILGENFSAAGYGFEIDESEGDYRAVWSKREAHGLQHLFYKLSVYRRDHSSSKSGTLPEPAVDRGQAEELQQTPAHSAMLSLVENAHQLSADNRGFVEQLAKIINDTNNADAVMLLDYSREKSRASVMVDLLTIANLPAHLIRGLYLESERKAVQPQELVETYIDGLWQIFDPVTGVSGLPDNFFMWQRGGLSLLDVTGGSNSSVTFSMIGNNISARSVALQQGTKVDQSKREAVALLDFSIYTLPIEQQNIFKLILLVPVGTLAVILLRVLVGLRTTGTFMPVLLALAFIQTQLITGLTIFLLILVLGLGIRSYLSRLNLLLVSRIAAVVIVVVMMMAFISVISYKLGIDQALTVTFFPMIILAWTIERMSILWEESGAREVVIQVIGTLVVASLAFALMTNPFIEHWTFNFPELTLCLLGCVLLLGQYSGYRLSELMRFRHLEGI